MHELRPIPMIIAVLAVLLAVAAEAGSGWLFPPPAVSVQAVEQTLNKQQKDHPTDSPPDAHSLAVQRSKLDEPPGLAVPSLVWLDGLLLLTVTVLGATIVVPEGTLSRIQAPVRLVVSVVVIVVSFFVALKAFAELMLMVGLFLAVPFGTIAYLAMWGFFDRSSAAAILSVIMLLKIVFVVALVIAQPAFLKGKLLMLMILTSLLANVLIGFLHGFVPIILVSITDAIGGIAVPILAIIWGLIIAIGSIIPTIKAIKPDKSSA
jgi:hypothetical protein